MLPALGKFDFEHHVQSQRRPARFHPKRHLRLRQLTPLHLLRNLISLGMFVEG